MYFVKLTGRNNMDRILVTGAAGFIGSHLTRSLLADGIEVLGLDIVNDYYDPRLKWDRVDRLKEDAAFSFSQTDLFDQKGLAKVFADFTPTKVVNLAAQAGVRYSVTHPHVYMDSNMAGFLNVLELCRKSKSVEGLIYASSSSVYGGNTKIPFSVEDPVDNPISLYAASKKANELMANCYSHLYGLHTTGLRFFTVYGPWGRPDMALFLFTKGILEDKPIQIFNNGEMKRDFTYVDDIVSGIRASIDKNYRCEIFNLGNHRSEKLMDFVHLIEEKLGKKARIEFKPMQQGDVPESFADIDKSSQMLGYKPTTNIDLGISNFVDWYRDYYKV
jgi:UDP-glucuronate 4-epimerase